MPYSPAGDLPNPGTEPRPATLQVDSLLSEPPEKPKNTGVSSLSLLQGNFQTQEKNWGLLHCRKILYHLSHHGSWKCKFVQSLGTVFYPKVYIPKNNLHKLIYHNISTYKMPKAALFQSKLATTQILINTRIDKYIFYNHAISSVQSVSHVRLFATP